MGWAGGPHFAHGAPGTPTLPAGPLAHRSKGTMGRAMAAVLCAFAAAALLGQADAGSFRVTTTATSTQVNRGVLVTVEAFDAGKVATTFSGSVSLRTSSVYNDGSASTAGTHSITLTGGSGAKTLTTTKSRTTTLTLSEPKGNYDVSSWNVSDSTTVTWVAGPSTEVRVLNATSVRSVAGVASSLIAIAFDAFGNVAEAESRSADVASLLLGSQAPAAVRQVPFSNGRALVSTANDTAGTYNVTVAFTPLSTQTTTTVVITPGNEARLPFTLCCCCTGLRVCLQQLAAYKGEPPGNLGR